MLAIVLRKFTVLVTVSRLLSMLQTSKLVHCHASLAAIYPPIPQDMDIQKVLVIHRHGDRSQISKTLGAKYPLNDDVTSIWNSLLPTDSTRRAMLLAAHPSEELSIDGDKININATLYAGWDKINFPYAQLTELGASQMIEVGKALRQRYVHTGIAPTRAEDMNRSVYCRSTTMCRTSQSLRSLLVGLCGISPDCYDENITPAKLRGLPRIIKRPYEEETLYPQGGSEAMISRREVVYPPKLIANTIADYAEFESRVKDTLGLSHKVSWETVMEVLHCHSVHGIKYIEGLTAADLDKAAEISAWHWGVLYKDKILGRLAIGRFLWDMMVDLRTALGESTAGLARTGPSTAAAEKEGAANKGMLIYSGHDSTLVPVLCALGIYDEKWPPYAAHLTLEVAASKVNPDQRFVRAVYNNQELPMFHLESVWCPLEDFWDKLRSVACSPEQFAAESVVRTATAQSEDEEGRSDISITSKEVEDEIAATLGARISSKP